MCSASCTVVTANSAAHLTTLLVRLQDTLAKMYRQMQGIIVVHKERRRRQHAQGYPDHQLAEKSQIPSSVDDRHHASSFGLDTTSEHEHAIEAYYGSRLEIERRRAEREFRRESHGIGLNDGAGTPRQPEPAHRAKSLALDRGLSEGSLRGYHSPSPSPSPSPQPRLAAKTEVRGDGNLAAQLRAQMRSTSKPAGDNLAARLRATVSPRPAAAPQGGSASGNARNSPRARHWAHCAYMFLDCLLEFTWSGGHVSGCVPLYWMIPRTNMTRRSSLAQVQATSRFGPQEVRSRGGYAQATAPTRSSAAYSAATPTRSSPVAAAPTWSSPVAAHNSSGSSSAAFSPRSTTSSASQSIAERRRTRSRNL